MGIKMTLESPPGHPVQIRRFEPGQEIRVAGKSTGSLGLPVSGSDIQIDISGPEFESLYGEDRTNWLGNFGVEFRLPNVYSEATIRVVEKAMLGQEIEIIPIGIGESAAPLPLPPDPLRDLGKGLEKWAMWVLLAAVALGALYVFLKTRK